MRKKPVTVVLKEGGPGEPEWTLSVRGSAGRARVELRTARARVVIAPDVSEPNLLGYVEGTADELETLQGRLRRATDAAPDLLDAMLEHEMPYDLHAELLTTLECVAEDDLAGAIDKLRKASAATPERLRRIWEEGRGAETREQEAGEPAKVEGEEE